MSVYSQPWWPNQKLLARPSFCITAIHWPANEPTTMMIRLTNRKFTPSFWYFGSCPEIRSEEHTSELQSLMRISYAVFCLKKKNNQQLHRIHRILTNTYVAN